MTPHPREAQSLPNDRGLPSPGTSGISEGKAGADENGYCDCMAENESESVELDKTIVGPRLTT